MNQITIDTPYSLENFLWLMNNSSVRSYLSEESLAHIKQAIDTSNEQTLKELYPIILEQFIHESEINTNFVLQQESLMNDFATNVGKLGFKIKAEIKSSNAKLEEQDKNYAENIIKQIE